MTFFRCTEKYFHFILIIIEQFVVFCVPFQNSMFRSVILITATRVYVLKTSSKFSISASLTKYCFDYWSNVGNGIDFMHESSQEFIHSSLTISTLIWTFVLFFLIKFTQVSSLNYIFIIFLFSIIIKIIIHNFIRERTAWWLEVEKFSFWMIKIAY